MLLAHGILNTFRVKLVGLLSDVSVWWHLVGTVVIVGALLIVPAHHQPASFLLTSKNLTGWLGPFAGIYVFCIGLLLAQYTLTGYDASAHMTEETHGADNSGPNGIVRSIYVSIIAAFILNIAMLLAMKEGAAAYASVAASRPDRRRADLRRRHHRVGRQVPGHHLDRRAVLLRYGLGHGQLADGLRLLP